MESQAGLSLWYEYRMMTGRTGTFDKNAPVLNGRTNSPFVVVPSAIFGSVIRREKDQWTVKVKIYKSVQLIVCLIQSKLTLFNFFHNSLGHKTDQRHNITEE